MDLLIFMEIGVHSEDAHSEMGFSIVPWWEHCVWMEIIYFFFTLYWIQGFQKLKMLRFKLLFSGIYLKKRKGEDMNWRRHSLSFLFEIIVFESMEVETYLLEKNFRISHITLVLSIEVSFTYRVILLCCEICFVRRVNSLLLVVADFLNYCWREGKMGF
jgi:hypothetical protein